MAHPDKCDCLYCTEYESEEMLMADIVSLINCKPGAHVWDNQHPVSCWKCGIPRSEANR